MEGRRENRKTEDGAAMALGLILIAVLSFAVFMSLANSNTEILIASNKHKADAAFCAASAGLEHARYKLSLLITESTNAWNVLLAEGTNLLDEDLLVLEDEGHTGSSYVVTVRNNPSDPSGSATVDLDNILTVTSRATFRDSTKEIEAELQNLGNVIDYAQEHRDASNTNSILWEINPVEHNRRLSMDLSKN